MHHWPPIPRPFYALHASVVSRDVHNIDLPTTPCSLRAGRLRASQRAGELAHCELLHPMAPTPSSHAGFVGRHPRTGGRGAARQPWLVPQAWPQGTGQRAAMSLPRESADAWRMGRDAAQLGAAWLHRDHCTAIVVSGRAFAMRADEAEGGHIVFLSLCPRLCVGCMERLHAYRCINCVMASLCVPLHFPSALALAT